MAKDRDSYEVPPIDRRPSARRGGVGSRRAAGSDSQAGSYGQAGGTYGESMDYEGEGSSYEGYGSGRGRTSYSRMAYGADEGRTSYSRDSYVSEGGRSSRERPSSDEYGARSPYERRASGSSAAANRDTRQYSGGNGSGAHRDIPRVRGGYADDGTYRDGQRIHGGYGYSSQQRSSATQPLAGILDGVRSFVTDATPVPVGPLMVDRRVVLAVAVALLLALIIGLGRCVSGCSRTDGVDGGQVVEQQAMVSGDDTAMNGEQLELAEAVPESEVEPVTVRAIMIGDILVHRGVWESGERGDGTRNYDHLFAHVRDQLAAADLKIVDQETVLGGDKFEISGYPMFNSPQEVGDAEVAAGFNCILRASNHSMDVWDDGLTSELTFWRTKHPEMLVVGAVMPGVETAAEAGPVYYEKDGFRIAILNYAEDLNGMPDYSDAVCEISEEQLRRDIAIAEENADLTIVCPHWGEEGSFTPNTFQRTYAQLMCDLGVDVVFGNHPHVMQPVQLLLSTDGSHSMPIFWSVGNFVSTMIDPENMVAGIGGVTMVKDRDGARVVSYDMTPIITHRGYGDEMTTYLLDDYNDYLASTNAWWGTEELPYPDWCNKLCSQILGEQYDMTTHRLRVELEPQDDAAVGGAAGAGGAGIAEADSTIGAAGSAEGVTDDVPIAA